MLIEEERERQRDKFAAVNSVESVRCSVSAIEHAAVQAAHMLGLEAERCNRVAQLPPAT